MLRASISAARSHPSTPHLISNINQALFYTHLTERWGDLLQNIDLFHKELPTLSSIDEKKGKCGNFSQVEDVCERKKYRLFCILGP